MTEKHLSRRLLAAIGAVLLTVVGIWAWNNKWTIYDQWSSRRYRATRDSSEVLSSLNLTAQGDLVYRASLTEVDGKDNFKTRCPVNDYENASVLGCYSDRKIYILKVDEPKLDGVEEVTAAHELLHARFERMSQNDKHEVGVLVNELYRSSKDVETTRLIDNYAKKLGPGESLDNEMFAIFGTQTGDIGARLEKIYAEYFKDRGEIVNKYLKYSSEFRRLEKLIVDYDSQLAGLKTEKDSLEAELISLGAQLSSDKQNIDLLQNSDSQEQYQSAAQAYNIKVGLYNKKVEQIRGIINQYNDIVEKRNRVALSAKNLTDKLNANVQEM